MNQVLTTGGQREVFGFYHDGKMAVRADSFRFTPVQLTKHEVFHSMAQRDASLQERLIAQIHQTYGPEQLRSIVETYGKILRDATGETLTEQALLEEILADAYAGMNRFKEAPVQQYTDSVQRWAEETPRAVRDAMDKSGTQRGPPDMQKYAVAPDFARQFRQWYEETDAGERMTSGGYFEIGTTSDALRSIGVRDRGIFWRRSKLGYVMDEHPEMTPELVEQIPQILENPIIVLKSKTQEDSITLFSEIQANGKPVMVAVNLTPIPAGGMDAEFSLVASAYGRTNSNAAKLIESSPVLYLDTDKNRTDTWLMSLGLQLPSDQSVYGSIGSIAYAKDGVNIQGVPYESMIKTAAPKNNAAEGLSWIGSQQPQKMAAGRPRATRVKLSDIGTDDAGHLKDLYWADDMGAEEYQYLNEKYHDSQRLFDENRAKYQAEREARIARTRPYSRDETQFPKAMEELGIFPTGGLLQKYADEDQLLGRAAAKRELDQDIRSFEAKIGATDAEKAFARDLANGLFDPESIPATMDQEDVLELADYYVAQKSFGLDMIKEQGYLLRDAADELARKNFQGVTELKKPRSIVLEYRTAQRNMVNAFGWEQGEKLNTVYITPVIENEAERIRFVNRMRDSVREFTDSNGKKRGLRKQERALAQQVMEGEAALRQANALETAQNVKDAAKNIQNGEDIYDSGQEFGLSDSEVKLAARLADYYAALDAMENGKADSALVHAAIVQYRQIYDKLYKAINAFLVVHGYEPIGFIDGYAPHMQPDSVQGLFRKSIQSLGIQPEVSQLPTSIAGNTADRKPGKRWVGNFLERTGTQTKYDIVEGFERYIDTVSDVFYHTDDIGRLRGATRFLRAQFDSNEMHDEIERISDFMHADPQTKLSILKNLGGKVKGVEGKLLSTDANAKGMAAANRISVQEVNAIYAEYYDSLFEQLEQRNTNNTLVPYLENYANLLAGKQTMADRGTEFRWGREKLNALNKLGAAFRKAKVAGSISSTLNQGAQIPNIIAEQGAGTVLRALRDMLTGKEKRADFALRSDFLTGKSGVDYIVTTPADMVIGTLFAPATFMDGMVSTLAVRAAYIKNLDQGMDEAQAIKMADQYGREVMGDRTKGAAPTGFQSKQFVARIMNTFQLEALNTWDHMISDHYMRDFKQIQKEQGKKSAVRAFAGVIVKTLLAAFVLNRLYEELYGGTPAQFDLLGMTANFMASGQGLPANEWIRTIIDNGLEAMGAERWFDTKQQDGKFDFAAAAGALSGDIMNEVPFARNVSGLLGVGDQTLPFPDMMGVMQRLASAVKESDLFGERGADAALYLAGEVLPGGAQLKKTVEGIQTMTEGGKMNGYGDNKRLQYPVEDSIGNWIRASLFGPYALSEGDKFYAAQMTGLSAKETELWRQLEDAGEERMLAYELIQDVKSLTGNKILTAAERAARIRDTINGAKMTDDSKRRAYESLVSDSRTEDFAAMMDAGLSWDHITQAHNVFADLDADDELKAGQKAARLANWVAQQGWSDTQAGLVKEAFTFFSHIPASATRYEAFLGAGIDEDTAMDLEQAMEDLQPEDGKENVSDRQKYMAVAESRLTESEKLNAMGVLMGTDSSSYEKLMAAMDAGLNIAEFVDLWQTDGAANRFLKLDERGVSKSAALTLAKSLAELEPEHGKAMVSDMQQYQAILSSGVSEREQLRAMGAVMGEAEYDKLLVVADYGISAKQYIRFKKQADKNGNGAVDQSEAKNAILNMSGLTQTQRAALWQAANKSWKSASNPFATKTGAEVYGKLNAGEDAVTGLQSQIRWKK